MVVRAPQYPDGVHPRRPRHENRPTSHSVGPPVSANFFHFARRCRPPMLVVGDMWSGLYILAHGKNVVKSVYCNVCCVHVASNCGTEYLG